MATCRAWELTYREPSANSDKFYRLYVFDGMDFDGKWAVQYGRRGTVGQFQFKHSGTKGAALVHADEQGESKARKGYHYTSAAVTFNVPDSYATLIEGKGSFLDHAFSSASPVTQDDEITAKRAEREQAKIDEFRDKLLAMRAKVAPRNPEVVEANPGESQLSGMEARLAAALTKARENRI